MAFKKQIFRGNARPLPQIRLTIGFMRCCPSQVFEVKIRTPGGSQGGSMVWLQYSCLGCELQPPDNGLKQGSPRGSQGALLEGHRGLFQRVIESFLRSECLKIVWSNYFTKRRDKKNLNSWMHSHQKHEGNSPEYKMKVEKVFKDPLSRQAGKAVMIRRTEGNVLNSIYLLVLCIFCLIDQELLHKKIF